MICAGGPRGGCGRGRRRVPLAAVPARSSARSAASSFSRAQSRSASRRELANTIVERCCSIRSSTCSSTCGQIDRRAAWPSGDVLGRGTGRRVQVGHVLDRHHDAQLDLLGAGRGGDGHRPGAAQERGHVLGRADRGRQADPLGRAAVRGQRVQPFQGQGQVRAALVPGQRVHLVHDDRVHPAQRVPRLGGEQQEQRFGRGDQDVRRAWRPAGGAPRRRCPRSAPRPGCRARARPWPARCAGSRSAGRAGSARCPPRAPSAGRCTAPGSAVSGPRGRAPRPAGPAPTGTPTASCPTRSGAMTRVFSPLPIAAQAWAWAWVGAANAAENQSRVTALKPSRGSLSVPAGCIAGSWGLTPAPRDGA